MRVTYSHIIIAHAMALIHSFIHSFIHSLGLRVYTVFTKISQRLLVVIET